MSAEILYLAEVTHSLDDAAINFVTKEYYDRRIKEGDTTAMKVQRV